jgi:putative photosynthetic complex assembly protein
MVAHLHDEVFPRPILIGAAGLVLASLVLVSAARLDRLANGSPTPQSAAGAASTPVVDARTVRLHQLDNGSLVVEALDGSLPPRTIPADKGGMVLGVLNGLRHQREAVGATGDDPILQITRLANGRILAEETASGMVLDLGAFGSTNKAAFAALLDGTELP